MSGERKIQKQQEHFLGGFSFFSLLNGAAISIACLGAEDPSLLHGFCLTTKCFMALVHLRATHVRIGEASYRKSLYSVVTEQTDWSNIPNRSLGCWFSAWDTAGRLTEPQFASEVVSFVVCFRETFKCSFLPCLPPPQDLAASSTERRQVECFHVQNIKTQATLVSDGREVEINYLPIRNRKKSVLPRRPTLCSTVVLRLTLGCGHGKGAL